VGLAARGSRQIGDEIETIEDQEELRQVRAQALRVNIKSVLVAIPLVLIALAIPPL
jgi:hypothetical protein